MSEPARRTIVLLDPDGTSPDGLFVVVHAESGVLYEQQCGGVSCNMRRVEGYLVPVAAYGPEAPISPNEFMAVFHQGAACFYNMSVLPEDRKVRLCELLAAIRFWPSGKESLGGSEHLPRGLLLDHSRLDELEEGWIPVLTPDGPGTLISPNCD